MSTQDKPELIVVRSLEFAQGKGYTIRRGAIFNWACTPVVCDWAGAVLLAINLSTLIGPHRDKFSPEWLQVLCRTLGVEPAWVWRVNHGFNYGNCLTFYGTKDKKEIAIPDSVSTWANQLANRWAR